MSLLRFGFTAVADTRQEVLDELDAMVQTVIEQVAGEPWLSVVDRVEKVMLDKMPTAILSGDAGFVYHGMREVVFTGPTKLGPELHFRDGYRPQGGGLDDFTL